MKTVYKEYRELDSRRFTPRELDNLAGIAPGKRKAWLLAGHVSFERRDIINHPSHELYMWPDVMQWAVLVKILETRYEHDVHSASLLELAPEICTRR